MIVEKTQTINDVLPGTEAQVLDRFSALKWYPQQEEWVRAPHGSDNACFNYPLALRLQGPLHGESLRRGLEEIVRRHQAFRSVFGVDGQEMVQMVLPPYALSLVKVSLERLGGERQNQTLRLAVEDAQKPFDLTRDPLLRATLLHIDAEEHVLLLTTHHLVCDDWSTDILLGELSQLYSEFSNGRPSPLPEIGYQYSDFVRQHTREMQGDELELRLQYWRQRFRGVDNFQYLTPDCPRSAEPTFRGRQEKEVLPAELDQAVKNFSQANGLSAFMTLVGGLLCLFARYSGSEDVGVGVCVANRNLVEVEKVIGPLSNRLLLRANVWGTMAVQEMLEQVRTATWEAYSFQEIPSGELLEKVVPERKANHNRMLQVLIVFENAPTFAWEFIGLKVSRFLFDTGTTCYDLHIRIGNHDGLQVSIQYDAQLFAPETIRQVLNDYRGILEAMIGNPHGLVRDLQVSTRARTDRRPQSTN